MCKRNVALHVIVALVGLLTFSTASDARAADVLKPTLIPEWTTGMISQGVGPSGIVVADLDKDGKTEIAACSQQDSFYFGFRGYAYVLRQTTTGAYDTVWYSNQIGCNRIVSGDRNGDGIRELYVGTLSGQVLIIQGDTFQTSATLSPQSGQIMDLAVADVNMDGQQEIVVAANYDSFVYSAANLNLLWHINLAGSQIAVGNVVGTAAPEIILNAGNSSPTTSYILDPVAKTTRDTMTPGFGRAMSIGEVDGDGFAEAAYITDWPNYTVHLMDVDTKTDKWTVDTVARRVLIADANQDGVSEVISGDGGGVRGYKGLDGSVIWNISNGFLLPPLGFAVGDADNDGTLELVWGIGPGVTNVNTLVVANAVTESVEWASTDLHGPLFTVAGDVDGDGRTEIVVASHDGEGTTPYGPEYASAYLYIYDAQTHSLEWSLQLTQIPQEYCFCTVSELALGQLDSDPGLEIVLGMLHDTYNSFIEVFDGATHTLQWRSPNLTENNAPGALVVQNVAGSALDDIIIGLPNNKVIVFDAATGKEHWEKADLDGSVLDLSVADADGDGVLDLAVLTTQGVYIFQTGTWTEKLHKPVTGGIRVAMGRPASGRPAELLVATTDYTNSTLEAHDTSQYGLLWQHSLGPSGVQHLSATDVDGDGTGEVIVIGFMNTGPSLLLIGTETGASDWIEYQMAQDLGPVYNVSLARLTPGGPRNLLIGAESLIQVTRVQVNGLRSLALPMVQR